VNRREKITTYIKTTLDSDFDADRHELAPLLDSVSLLQLIAFIEQEMGIALDLPSLRLEMFRNVDSIVHALDGFSPEAARAIESEGQRSGVLE